MNVASTHAHVPIVVVTGLCGEDRDLQVKCVLRKPADPARLVEEERQCGAATANGA